MSAWGVIRDPSMPFANDYCCPHCQGFSFFCNGRSKEHAATAWRSAVVGFQPAGTRSGALAVLLCGNCSRRFVLPLKPEVIGAYQNDCKNWPEHEYAKAA